MQQLIAFFISVFLFASLFLNSVGSIIGRQGYRNAKRELNLLGRDVVNFTYFDSDGSMVIDEIAFLENITNMNYSGDILGGIFFYEGNIRLLKKGSKNYFTQEIPVGEMNEQNKINTINQMLYFLLSDKEYIEQKENVEINIVSDRTNDYLAEELFNRLDENTVFIVGYQKGHIFLSGFVLKT